MCQSSPTFVLIQYKSIIDYYYHYYPVLPAHIHSHQSILFPFSFVSPLLLLVFRVKSLLLNSLRRVPSLQRATALHLHPDGLSLFSQTPKQYRNMLSSWEEASCPPPHHHLFITVLFSTSSPPAVQRSSLTFSCELLTAEKGSGIHSRETKGSIC